MRARMVLGFLAMAACRQPGAVDGGSVDGATPTPPDAAAVDAPPVTDVDAAPPDAAPPDAAVDAAVDAMPVDGPPPLPTPPDVAYAPPQPLPPGQCAPPLAASFTGNTGSEYDGCSSCSLGHSASVTWQLASTTGCVDRYVPSGTAHHVEAWACHSVSPGHAPIAATDGELVVDRSTIPPTYEMRGATTWMAATDDDCDDVPPAGSHPVTVHWAHFRGEIAGDAFGGGHHFESWERWWRFWATTPPPPTAPCVEPAVDFWVGASSHRTTRSARVTWIRVATTDCVDLFVPVGTMTHAPGPIGGCQHAVATPDQGPIGPDDGHLTIDRRQWPPRFRMWGETRWAAQLQCTRHDGTVVTYPEAGGTWAGRVEGVYSGDRFAAETTAGPLEWYAARKVP